MKRNNERSKSSLASFLLAGVLGLSFFGFTIKSSNLSGGELSLFASPKEVARCIPLNRFDFNSVNLSKPIAPKLDIAWQSNLQITSQSTESKYFFNQGLFFLYAFNHAEAERAFREAARLDSSCAMCHWGVALSLGPNINRPMPEAYQKDAYTFSQKALELSVSNTEKEKALIEALSIRYGENPPKHRSELDLKYANTMRIVSHRYREDLDIATLFAESLMDLMPWNYWLEGGIPRPETKEVHATLEYVMEKDANHPGANHYYIHTMEEYYPERAESSAERLSKVQYSAGHLTHMPSHIFIQLGRFHDANQTNQVAVEIDETYLTETQAQGYYPALYYPHNLHFLYWGASLSGQYEVAMDAARKTAKKGKTPRFKAIPLFSMLRFGKWKDILKEPVPNSNHPYMSLLWHHAKGMALAKTGKLKRAKVELSFLEKEKQNKKLAEISFRFLPVQQLSEIFYLVLEAEIKGCEGKLEEQIVILKKTVELQDQLRYSEPPHFYIPIRQALGAALLKANRPSEAEKTYREELADSPKNGWSLFGLYQSLKEQDKKVEAEKVFNKFEEAWKDADVELKSSII